MSCLGNQIYYPEANNSLATIAGQQGNIEEALKLFNNAILLKPNYAEVYFNIGIILKKKNKPNEALDSYQKAINFRHQQENS